MDQEGGGPKAPSAVWKNPYVIGFLIGAAVLTVLPFLQGRMLRAPPPLGPVGPWALATPSGERFESSSLAGAVWLASFVGESCDERCQKAQAEFEGILKHLEDLPDRFVLISFVQNAQAAAQLTETAPRRLILVGSPKSFGEAFAAWASLDGGAPQQALIDAGALALVDQTGALRGFWPPGEPGRGNLINAARLMARRGPSP